MFHAGASHLLCFIVSLIVGHALTVLLSAYVGPAFMMFIKIARWIDSLLGIGYSHKEIAAFILATILAFPLGILFNNLFKVTPR